MSTLYGHRTDANFTLCISKAESGGAPSGDRYLFECVRLKIGKNFLQKITETAGGIVISSKDGKLSNKITIQEAWVLQKSGDADVTLTYNNITGFLDSLQDAGESPAYLWAKNRNDNRYINLARFNKTTTTYCKGYVDKYDVDHEGPTFVFNSINWIGVSN